MDGWKNYLIVTKRHHDCIGDSLNEMAIILLDVCIAPMDCILYATFFQMHNGLITFDK